jgi:hypothetical protein
MWWFVDLVRGYARGWRDDIAKLTTDANDLELRDMKVMLLVVFSDVGQWLHELLDDQQRKLDRLAEIQQRTRFRHVSTEKCSRRLWRGCASGEDPLDVTLPVVDEVHMRASNVAAAGIVYIGIARLNSTSTKRTVWACKGGQQGFRAAEKP